MPIQVTIDGVGSFLTDDLTVAESVAIEKATGRSWYELNPFRRAEDCQEVMVAFLARTVGEDVARKQVGAMTVAEVVDCLEVVPDDRPQQYVEGMPDPKAGDGSATTG